MFGVSQLCSSVRLASSVLISEALLQFGYEIIWDHAGWLDPHLWEANISECVLDEICPLKRFGFSKNICIMTKSGVSQSMDTLSQYVISDTFLLIKRGVLPSSP